MMQNSDEQVIAFHWEVSRALYIQDFELSLVTKTMGIKELKIVSKTGSAKQ